jgi:hypothetical protein
MYKHCCNLSKIFLIRSKPFKFKNPFEQKSKISGLIKMDLDITVRGDNYLFFDIILYNRNKKIR